MATENNNLGVRVYTKQYVNLLGTVFDVKKAFAYALSPIQVLDGVTENATAFTVKTNNTPVVINNYNKGANVGMGTGTSNSSRFGECTEIIYGNTDVPYGYDLAIHEGIDRATVNMGFDTAIADRLELQSIAQTKRMNTENGKYISANASETKTLADTSDANITKLFNELSEHFTDNEVDAGLSAYVTPELYNALVNSGLATTAKNSSANIDGNELYMFKGFKIIPTPSKYFVKGEYAYVLADGIIIPFVGASIARTIETEDFDGVKLQARAKGGSFVTDDNKVAIVKVTEATP